MLGGATGGIFTGLSKAVIMHMITVHVMQVTVMQVIGVTIVLYLFMTTTFAVLVIMAFMFVSAAHLIDTP